MAIHISIHAPHAGSDEELKAVVDDPDLFLSTLPMRGATDARYSAPSPKHYFYPRSPCGERHPAAVYDPGSEEFLSTLPMRGATTP